MSMTKEGWIKRKANGNGIPWNKGLKGFSGPQSNSWRGGEIILVCMDLRHGELINTA
jgi:hypothetical protein